MRENCSALIDGVPAWAIRAIEVSLLAEGLTRPTAGRGFAGRGRR
jgi:hypothetical protein